MVPPAFSMAFAGPDEVYTIRFRPTDDWDGVIDLSIGERPMRWTVLDANQETGGTVVLGGVTDGTEEVWGDQFWFELRFQDTPPIIRYWGDQVVWWEDRAA